jgi:hypothetical protein
MKFQSELTAVMNIELGHTYLEYAIRGLQQFWRNN